MGDSAVTIGFGISETEGSTNGTSPSTEEGGMHIGVSAVTGDLTVALGFADGDHMGATTAELQIESLTLKYLKRS